MTTAASPDTRTDKPLPAAVYLSSVFGTGKYRYVCPEHGRGSDVAVTDKNDAITVKFRCGCRYVAALKWRV